MYCLEDNPLRCSISFSRGSSRHKTKTNTCTFKLAQVPPLPDLTHPTDSLLSTYRIIERHIYTYTYIHIYIHTYIYMHTYIHIPSPIHTYSMYSFYTGGVSMYSVPYVLSLYTGGVSMYSLSI